MYYFDINGWLSAEPIEGRSTLIEPMAAEGDMRPNFTGHKWMLMKYATPTPPDNTDQTDILQRLEQIEQEAAELRQLLTK